MNVKYNIGGDHHAGIVVRLLVESSKYLVPGDVVYYDASLGPPIHIGFVYTISYLRDREPNPSLIKIIHATTWFRKWKVQNIQTIINLVNDKPYKLTRMQED